MPAYLKSAEGESVRTVRNQWIAEIAELMHRIRMAALDVEAQNNSWNNITLERFIQETGWLAANHGGFATAISDETGVQLSGNLAQAGIGRFSVDVLLLQSSIYSGSDILGGASDRVFLDLALWGDSVDYNVPRTPFSIPVLPLPDSPEYHAMMADYIRALDIVGPDGVASIQLVDGLIHSAELRMFISIAFDEDGNQYPILNLRIESEDSFFDNEVVQSINIQFIHREHADQFFSFQLVDQAFIAAGLDPTDPALAGYRASMLADARAHLSDGGNSPHLSGLGSDFDAPGGLGSEFSGPLGTFERDTEFFQAMLNHRAILLATTGSPGGIIQWGDPHLNYLNIPGYEDIRTVEIDPNSGAMIITGFITESATYSEYFQHVVSPTGIVLASTRFESTGLYANDGTRIGNANEAFVFAQGVVDGRADFTYVDAKGQPIGVFDDEWTGEDRSDDIHRIREYNRHMRSLVARFAECFAAGTPILMADGSTKPIEEIQVDDQVASFDGTGPLQASRVERLYVNDVESFIRLQCGTLVTSEHPFLCADGQFRPVSDILENNISVLDADNNQVQLSGTPVSAESVGKTKRYNFSVEGTHTYVAAGYRVHNVSYLEFLPAGAQISGVNGLGPSGGYVIAYIDAETGDKVQLFWQDTDGDGYADVALKKDQHGEVTVERSTRNEAGLFNFATIGRMAGSLLSSTLVDDGFSGYVQSVVIQAVVLNAGQALAQALGQNLGAASQEFVTLDNKLVVADVHAEVWADLGRDVSHLGQGVAVGALSSYLAGELFEALGVEGFAAELGQSLGSAVLSEVFSNVTGIGDGIDGLFNTIGQDKQFSSVFNAIRGRTSSPDLALQTDWSGMLKKQVVAFFAVKLSNAIIEPKNKIAAILNSLGASFGASLGPIGSFVFATIGTFIGNLFGAAKPKIPQADAETLLNFNSGYYQIGNVTSQNGGNEDLVREMAEAARDISNNVISLIVGGSEIAENANLVSPTQVYGHTGGDLWVKLGGHNAAKNIVDSADEAVDKGALYALRSVKVVGGDLFIKRLITKSNADSVTSMLGDLQVASDYGQYLRTRDLVNDAIASTYTDLSDEQKAYLENNRALITRVLAAPRDADGNIINDAGVMFDDGSALVLNAADEAEYRANTNMIDEIIDSTRVSQFAAGWIITLQRASELGLDEASKSDFYGGAKGLLDSLQVMSGNNVHLEDTRFMLDGTTLNVDFGAVQGPGANLLRGGDLSEGVSIFYEQTRSAAYGDLMDLSIETVDGREALVVREDDYSAWTNGTYAAGGLRLITGDLEDGHYYSVREGEVVTIGFEGKNLRADNTRSNLIVWFFDENNTNLGSAHIYLPKGSQTWTRVEKTATVPTGAVKARIASYLYGRVGSSDPVPTQSAYALANFQFSRSPAGTTTPQAWSAPVYERFTLEDVFNKANLNKVTGLGDGPAPVSSEAQAALYAAAAAQGHTVVSPIFSSSGWIGPDVTSRGDVYIYEGSANQTVDDTATESASMSYSYWWQGGTELIFDEVSVTITHTGGDDIFITGSGDDVLRGYDGDDWLSGGLGRDTIYGGAGNDVIIGGGGTPTGGVGGLHERLYGGDGDDYIHVGSAPGERAFGYGENGNDIIADGQGAWEYGLGGNGDDTIIVFDDGGGTRDAFRGDAGSDTASWERWSSGQTLDLNIYSNNGAFGSSDTRLILNDYFLSFENITGTQHDDIIIGDGLANVLRGLNGDDTITGGAGNDTLEGGLGADTLNGGSGTDTASYKTSNRAVWLDLENVEFFGGHANGDTFSNIQNLKGSDFDDTLFGKNGVAGTFWGERGDDWFIASTGVDTIYGGVGFDTVDYAESTSAVTVNLATGLGAGGAVSDRYYDIEQVVGSDFNDTLTGSSGDEFFQGGLGNDTLTGGAGMDTYVFNRGDGHDTIVETDSGVGYDTLVFGDGVNWSDLIWSQPTPWISNQYHLELTLKDGGGSIFVAHNYGEANQAGSGIDAVDVGGVGAVDFSHINYAVGGSEGADSLYGRGDRHDVMWGYAGNDVIYGSYNNGAFQWENLGNVIIAGRGNDQIWTSVGDDQFVFDVGDGRDTIYDSGGIDRIQFGPSVGVEDVIFRVHNGDLYIGIRDYSNPELDAHEVDDYIRVVGGSASNPKIEHVTAGGVDIDLRKIDLTPPPLDNSAPSDIVLASGGTVNENSANGTIVADFDATDPDGDALTFSLSNTAGGRFAINATTGVVTVANGSLLDFETNTSHVIGVTVTDPDGLTRNETFTISINDVSEGGGGSNQAPNAVNDSATAEFLGGTATALIVPLFNDSDPDGDTLSIHSFTQAGFGTLTQTGNAFTFQASAVFANMSTSFTYTVTDGNGGFDTATVNITVAENTGGGGFLFPVVVDLDGDGADFISVHQSRVVMQRAEDGALARIGWVGADDGLLALDRDGDGLINRVDEISFVGDLEGAQTDLEGLQAFDTNGDGKLTAADERWGDFTIWQDANENGFGSAAEQRTLDEIGITEISLNRTPTGKTLTGNDDTVVLNTTEVTFADGTVVEGYDTAFRLELARETGQLANLNGVQADGAAHAGRGKFGVAVAEDGVLADLYHARAEADMDRSTFQVGRELSLFVDVDDALAAPEAADRYKFDPVTQTFGVAPIVVDMDGDGVELLDPGQSPILGDFNGDGVEDRLGWANAQDAFLAFDRNNDGLINGINEISFLEDLPGAETDLQGLRAFDSNGNGLFDSGDEQYANFSLWQDRNYDGLGSADELISLADAGFESISLGYTDAAADVVTQFNIVHGQAEVTWSDGTIGFAGDISLQGFAGIAEEQAKDAYYRNNDASGRNAWGFDRSARRGAMQELERQSLADGEGASVPDFRANLNGAVGLRDLAFGQSMLELNDEPGSQSLAPLGLRPIAEPAGEPVLALNLANTSHNAVVDVEPLRLQPRTDRWWLAALEGQDRTRRGLGALAQTLSRLDSEREAIAPGRANAQSLEPASALAERQRLLQAMASFRGASGAPVLSRNDATDLAGRTSMLAPNRLGDAVNMR